MQRVVGKLKRPFGNLHYEVTGSGPVLIFAHGLGGNQMSWWQQVAHFAPRYTCVTFAHRGFAPSDPIPDGPDAADYAGDLAALIDHLNFADVRLVGQSMGGWTVLDYAIAHPDRVSALVLSSTSGTIDRRGADPSGGVQYDAWLKDSEAKIAQWRSSGIHPAMGVRAAEKSPALHLLYKSIDEMAGALDKERVRTTLRRIATLKPDDLKEFRVPTLLIAGAEDVVFPPFLATALAASLPCADAQLIAESGHSPYFERADSFNQMVEHFIARHP